MNLLLHANREETIRLELKVASYNEAVSVEVPAGRVENAAPSTIDVSPLEVRSVAGAGENIFHVLQISPCRRRRAGDV